MNDIRTTEKHFYNVCAELGCRPHPYIKKMLTGESCQPKGKSMHLYLAGNNKLLTEERLKDEDALVIYKTLSTNFFVAILDLRYNNITDEGAKHIGKLLEENLFIFDLNIMGNDIGPDGGEAIAAGLACNKTLLYLRVNGNKIENKGGMAFAQALQTNQTLKLLDLGDTDQKTESMIALATILNYNKSIKALNVNNPLLFSEQEEVTNHYAKMLKINTVLVELHIQKAKIRDFGATHLTENLLYNFTLMHLDLSCNRIARDGVKQLAKFLRVNNVLKVLDLGFNRIEDDGAIFLSLALQEENKTLTTLVIVSNCINAKGLCAIANCMYVNTTLTNVYIWGNNLETLACDAFAKLVKTKRLDLKNTDVKPYKVDGVNYLCQIWYHTRRLYYWEESDNLPEQQPHGSEPFIRKKKEIKRSLP